MKLKALLLLASLGLTTAIDCGNNEIACSNGEQCSFMSSICDFGRDCSDASDEDEELCTTWRKARCSSSSINCFRDGEKQCVEISEYCTSEYPSCESLLDPRVCSMIVSKRLGELSNFSPQVNVQGANLNKSNELINRFYSLLPNTMSHKSCPDLYTLVGDQCLSFFYVGSVSWGEARAFCSALGGDLVTLKNISQFADVVQHLQRHVLPSRFWIGGSVRNYTVGWTWIDGSPMEMGSPFWATRYTPFCIKSNVTTAKSDETCYHYYQNPKADPLGECASISFQHSYYIADEDCLRKMSPLCVYQGTDFPKRPEF